MNTLKSVMVVGALAVVGYGVYAMLNNNSSPSTPPWPAASATGGDAPPAPNYTGAPNVSLGAPAPAPGMPGAPGAPGAAPSPAMPGAMPGYPTPASATPLAATGQPAPMSIYPAPGYPTPGGPATAVAPGSQAGRPMAGVGVNSGGLYDRPGVAPSAGAPAPTAVQPGLYGQPAVAAMVTTPPPNGAIPGRYGAPAVAGQPGTRYDIPPAGGITPVPPVGGITSVAPAPTPAPSFETTMTAARAQLNQGRLDPALLTLSLIYDDEHLNDRQQEELNELLDQVAGTVIYSRSFPIGPPHRVAPGETWATVSQKYGVPSGLLAKINGLDDRTELTPGQELKVVRGPFQALVNVPKRTLTLMVAGRYAGRFPISLGEEFKQIQGSYTINAKTLQHSRYDGQRYLELKPADGSSTPPVSLAIVGMTDPTVAERGQAQGLIAVTPQNAGDLYDILSQGSKVTIRR